VHVTALQVGPSWNYTTFLNIAFLVVIAVLLWRFVRTGGPAMLRMMSAAPGHGEHADHEHHQHEHQH
jgi:ABC-type nickel/cobalt efflux system permease component RcnA